jgi:hypothetical protein
MCNHSSSQFTHLTSVRIRVVKCTISTLMLLLFIQNSRRNKRPNRTFRSAIMHSAGGCKAKGATRRRALEASVKVKICDILFTQDTGFSTFTDKRWLAQTMYEIAKTKLNPQDLPLLRVCRSEDGRLWSLDNRRLYVLRECKVRSILVELIDHTNECLEYTCKRFGMINGSTSEGKVLVIKQGTQCGGKQGKMSVSALMPCLDCGQTAFVRFQRLKFVKYNKKAVLDDCATCEQLVGWCKKL